MTPGCAQRVEAVVSQVPGTLSAFSERVMGGNYLDVSVDRAAITRYGSTVADVQDVIQSAVGYEHNDNRRGPGGLRILEENQRAFDKAKRFTFQLKDPLNRDYYEQFRRKLLLGR